MFNKYKKLFEEIGYTLVHESMFYGKGYYIKPLTDSDEALNYKWISNNITDLKSSYEFNKEYYNLNE